MLARQVLPAAADTFPNLLTAPSVGAAGEGGPGGPVAAVVGGEAGALGVARRVVGGRRGVGRRPWGGRGVCRGTASRGPGGSASSRARRPRRWRTVDHWIRP